ncbi:hypothetical protein SNF32_04885 [Enterococcus mundtii]|nr:hypothetical protein [Enterococcus mundtii]
MTAICFPVSCVLTKNVLAKAIKTTNTGIIHENHTFYQGFCLTND